MSKGDEREAVEREIVDIATVNCSHARHDRDVPAAPGDAMPEVASGHSQVDGSDGSSLSGFNQRKLWQGRFPGSRPRVAYYAPFTAEPDLDAVAGGYRDALARLPIDLECIDTAAVLAPPRAEKIATTRAPPDIIVLHHNANELDSFLRLAPPNVLDTAYVIGIWLCETPSLPGEWCDAFAAFDEIWVPSQFCARAILAVAPAGLPVHIIPQIVPVPSGPITASEQSAARRAFGIPQAAFCFLCLVDVSRSIERANPQAVLRAFAEAFGGDPRAFLIVQFRAATSDPDAVREIRRAYAASNVMFIDLAMSQVQIDAMIQAADCVVSAHRAEGFGRDLAKIMAWGKPAIVTDWSGGADFCDGSNAIMITADLTEIAHANGVYAEGGVWAEPRACNLVAAMQRILNTPELATQLGSAARSAIAQRLSLTVVSEKIGAIIADLVARRVEIAKTLAQGWETRPGVAWRHSEALARPTISVIVSVYNTAPRLLVACIVSVLNQTSRRWELCLCDDASTDPATIACIDRLRARDQRIRIRRFDRHGGISRSRNAAAEMAGGRYVALLESNDTIAPNALESYEQAIREHPACDMFYSDEDTIDLQGRSVDHHFKPDWSPDHLESCMYLGHMLVIRKKVLLALGGYREAFDGAQDFDLALRISAKDGEIAHIPQVLYHQRLNAGPDVAQIDADIFAVPARNALADYAALRYGADARVDAGMAAGLFRIRRGEISQPPVSLIILTNSVSRDIPGRGSINLAENFLNSIIAHTEYVNFRILMISDGDLTSRCRETLQNCGGREIIYEQPGAEFNFADKANFSIKAATTDLVVLLNDDMEVRNPGWLGALVDQIVKEDVGAVGANLCFPDERIQHVGMAMGINETTAHIYYGQPGDTLGYHGYAVMVRNWSAVTGACLATRKTIYERVGGLDTAFGADFNDTDYCLKLRRLGYRIVYTPHARLYHFENQSFKRTSLDPGERSLFLERWAAVVDNDPYYNPNLSRTSLTFEVALERWPA